MGIDNWVLVAIIAGFFFNALYTKGGLAKDKRDQVILIIAMGFTLIADIFMLMLDMNAFGVLIFCAVQTAHNYRFTNKRRTLTQVTLGIITFLVAFLLGVEVLFALGAAYAVFIFFSITGSFMAYRKYPSPNNIMIVAGMILFMFCDIFVLIYYTQRGLPAETRDLVFRAIWICYLPSQALLSSSARKARDYKEEDELKRMK